MHEFANLLDKLFYTYSHLEKAALLKDYIANTPDPERGLALAIITGNLDLTFFKMKAIIELISTKIDPVLFDLSFDYVGDIAETVALLWPEKEPEQRTPLPSLSQLLEEIHHLSKVEQLRYIANLMDNATAAERWAIIKLGTGNLRIGISTRFVKQVLAQYGNKDINEIERIWHGIQPPYESLLAWLENKAPLPDIQEKIYFHPVMLSHPLTENELAKIDPNLFAIERKYDGIRVQLLCTTQGKALFSRSGDNISGSFPDALEQVNSPVILDGELFIARDGKIGSFNDLQQRLNRKTVNKKLVQEAPAHIILYDILEVDKTPLQDLPFNERRKILENWLNKHAPVNMSLSEIFICESANDIKTLRQKIIDENNIAVEGLMIKRKDSLYVPGRPVGMWYKWKRDPYLVDAVLMYAQRGHGKRSSYYSDYTFGLWENEELLPIGKAYFGFSDAELAQLDKWVRHNTIQKFGPVREVKKALVLEIAFDAVNESKRHKSGYALRFPRINRIRWDKPALEADLLAILKNISASNK